MVSKTPKSYYKPYLWLCVLRVVLVFIPQTGYIHPDEFFQTVEVFAGRIFELDVSLPWEFNATSPARSMGVPYLAIGFGYKIMQTLDYFLRIYFKFTIITPYFLLIFPRFFLCMLTFLVDYSLYKICLNNNEKYRSRLLILASSYVVLVFSSHTFTNSIEMILFAILLFFVSESMIFSNIIVRQREYINKRYDKSTTPAERAKFHKLRIFLASDSYRNCFQISTVAVMGFFNRPTFLFYCLFPIFFWLYRGIGFKSVTSMQFHTRILALIACAIPTILALIIFDSFFFGYITWGEIGMLDVSVNSFVFPPLNFIKYNMDQENLALHGIHPRYNHVLLNVPLLYNVLGIFAIIGLSDMLRKLWKKKYHLLPTIRSIRGLMTASFIAPVFALSIFPHQEARFLIPTIIPIVYLYANDVYKETDNTVIPAPKDGVKKEIPTKKTMKKETTFYLKLWLIINVVFTMLFGFLHQGGIYPAAAHLSHEINQKPHINYHIITNHIYGIPHMYFLQPDENKLFYKRGSAFKVSKHVFTYETKSIDLDSLYDDILSILSNASQNKRKYKVYLVLTGSLHEKFMSVVKGQDFTSMYVQHKTSFYPHFSGEAPPDFTDLIELVSNANVKNIELSYVYNCLYNIVKSLSLNIYEISLPHSHYI